MRLTLLIVVALVANASPAAADPPDKRFDLAGARVALEAGRAEEALSHLEGDPGVLADYAAVLRGQAMVALGRMEAARAAVEGITRAPRGDPGCKPGCVHPLWVAATLVRADALKKQAPALAAAELMKLDADGERWDLAIGLYRAAGDAAAARGVQGKLLSEIPMTLPAKKLARKLGPKGVAATIGDDAARMLRIRRLLAAHLNDQARREARAAQASMKANRCELLYIEGKANRKMRRYKGAVKAFSAAREACRDGDEKQPWWFKASLLETQVRSIRGDLGGARKVAMALAEHTEHSYADDALFRLADLNGRRSRPKQARRLYTQIVEDHPRGDQVPIAAWRLALAELRRGRHDAARPWLERLANSLAPTSRDGARARYWLARGLEASDRPRALKLYRAAVKTPPLTFYAWLALARLRRVAPPVAKELQLELQALRDRVASSTAASSAPTSVDASPERRRARALQAIGWSAEAARELKLLEHDAMTEPEVVALALAYDELQEHQWAQWLLRSRAKGALSRFPTGPTLEVWKAAYSRPYLDEVSRASKATGVPALLLFGLSREESTFDPRVISWAGAVGLMQLMPATAVGAYADVYRKRLTDMSRLTDPALNARLGAHVLKTGLDDFGQSVPLALAAYNGGHGLARKTLPRGRKQAFDLWVESITVRQTRRYVKKVVGTWGKYRFLYDAKAPFIELPAHVPARPAPPKEPPKDPPKANK